MNYGTLRIQLETGLGSRFIDPVNLQKYMECAASKATERVKPLVEDAIMERFALLAPHWMYGGRAGKKRGGIWANHKGTEAVISGYGERIGLIHFKHSPTTLMRGKTSGGVSAEVRRGETHHLPHSFIAKDRRSNREQKGVYHRLGGESYPIQQNRGSSLPEMMSESTVTKRIADQLILRYEMELARQLG